jgi:hypothetical protein
MEVLSMRSKITIGKEPEGTRSRSICLAPGAIPHPPETTGKTGTGENPLCRLHGVYWMAILVVASILASGVLIPSANAGVSYVLANKW